MNEIDLREHLARIDRAIAENAKRQEETRKYEAEAQRTDWKYRYFPCIQLAFSAAIAALVAAAAVHWR